MSAEMTIDVDTYDAYEQFYLALNWFVSHLEAIAEEPAKASELHGHFNVAHEFWYFVGGDEYVISDPLHLFSDDVRASVIAAVESVKAVPEDARAWTETIDGSLQNMRHPAWIHARKKAGDAMRLLQPSIARMKAFFEQPNPSF